MIGGYFYCFQKMLGLKKKAFLGCMVEMLKYNLLEFFVFNKHKKGTVSIGSLDKPQFMKKLEKVISVINSDTESKTNFYAYMANKLKANGEFNDDDVHLFSLLLIWSNVSSGVDDVIKSLTRSGGFVSFLLKMSFLIQPVLTI